MMKVLLQILRALFFFLELWRERDKKQIKVKAEIAQKLIGAFAETNRMNKASRLNIVVQSINRLR